MAPQGFNTTFMYTEGHIRDVLIPQLQQIRDMYLEAGSDSARFYARQVDTWEQILKMNKKQKEQSKFIENKSISSGVSYESFTETTSTESYTFDFSLFLETAVAVEIGSEVMGSGVMLGAEVKFRMAYGQSETTTFTETRKTGFVLEDDDEGDYFSVDILVDPVYATPVFKLKSGATSCPWEPGTQPREGVQLTTNTYYQYVDEPQGQAIFQLNLGNTSQSDEEREYNLVFLQESNPDGAVITLGGSPVQGGVPTPYTIGPAESVDATVTVKIGPLAYDYNNLIFSLMSGCEVPDPSIVDYVELDVNFASPCSEVVMAKPYDNWYINDAMNSILQVVIEDYDTTIFNMAKLQYSPAGLNTWSNALIVEPKDMADVPTIRYLSLHKLDDGLYDIRVALECTDALSYSKVSTGIIDRRPPEAFGLPEPRDGVLDPGDMISVEFNEDIDCHSVHFENITVTNLGTGVNLNVQTGCKDDMVLIMPDTTGVVFDNDTFQINLTGIEDIYGNAMSDTLIWRFVLPSSENITLPDVDDYDEDGILNDADNCPISANADQEDLDEDGIGDVCDPDMDNDAIMNIGDNCPFSSNNNQHDLDEDGIGDTCDVDIDGDEVENQYDNCVYVYNPDQSDVDDDQIGDACSTVGIKEAASVESIQLFGNYPNPFNDQTTFRYNIPFACEVEISVVNMTGMVVEILKSKNDIPGKNEILWNTKDFASGVYYYRFKVLDTGGNIKFQENRMMILSR